MSPATVVETEPPKRNPGFVAGVLSLGRQAWKAFWEPPDPLKMYPDEARQVRLYYERTTRVRSPHPYEGEATHARSCFFLKKFSGKRELFWVDTDEQRITPLAFLAFWKGEPEHYDLEIGSITDHERRPIEQPGVSGNGNTEEVSHG